MRKCIRNTPDYVLPVSEDQAAMIFHFIPRKKWTTGTKVREAFEKKYKTLVSLGEFYRFLFSLEGGGYVETSLKTLPAETTRGILDVFETARFIDESITSVKQLMFRRRAP